MKGLTDYITQSTWSDMLTVIYALIDDRYKQLNPALRPRRKFAPRRHQLTQVMEAIHEHLRDCWRAAHPLETSSLSFVRY